jgi:hypothetical protein
MWSKELIELSKEHFETGYCNVKNGVPEFGELTRENNQFKIKLFNSDIEFTYNSIDDILKAGWAVD